jgi:hypothetical protein
LYGQGDLDGIVVHAARESSDLFHVPTPARAFLLFRVAPPSRAIPDPVRVCLHTAKSDINSIPMGAYARRPARKEIVLSVRDPFYTRIPILKLTFLHFRATFRAGSRCAGVGAVQSAVTPTPVVADLLAPRELQAVRRRS